MSKSKRIFNSSISIILCLLMTCSIFVGSIIPASALNSVENDSEISTNTDNYPISSEEILNALNNAEIVDTSEDSKFVLADSSVEISDDYFPNTADIYEAQQAYDEQITDEGIASVSENEQDYVGDPMVYYTQKWLNQEYGNVPGFGSVPENGKTGWATVNGLLRALQHELGITNLADNFGPTTSSLYAQNILRRQDGVTDRKFAILQGALWCKGYCPGYNYSYSNGTVSINAVFDETVENAVKQLQKDAGLATQDGIVSLNIMKALMSMDSFKLLPTSYGSDANIRAFQQWMNQKYETYTGLNPCDGVFGRNTNKALIYALQAEEGMPTTVANGNFGNTTLLCCPDIPYNINDTNATRSYPGNSAGSLYSYSNVTSFTKLAQFALYVNGFGNGNFNGIFDNATRQAVRQFQEHHVININGNVTKGTWLSLFISCGDRSRNASAADCATILTQQKAEALYNNGYRYIGRYLTGTYGGGINKALSRDEAEIILNAGLNFFPIFEEGGWQESYFTAAQGTIDAKKAINKAKEIGIPEGTIIYFAVDFDAMDYQITQRIIPYFQRVHEEMSCDIYKTGIYGARNVCSRVSEQGYACASFVGNMSTGFSGNLGYKMPSNWTFDQFTDKDSNGNYLTILSSDGNFNIDKDAVSGRDTGVDQLNDIDTNEIVIGKDMLGSASNDTLYGPTVNILGYQTPIFQLDMSLDMGFLHTDIDYDNEKETTEIIIGLDLFQKTSESLTRKEKKEIFKDSYTDVKTLLSYMGKSPNHFANYFDEMQRKMFLDTSNLKQAFNFDVYFIGYMKLDAQGRIVEGELGLLGTTKASYSVPLAIPSVFFKFQIEGSLQTKFTFILSESGNLQLSGNSTFSTKLSMGFEGNIILAHAYAGLSGEITCKLKYPVQSFSSSLTAEFDATAFFEWDALFWSGRNDWKFIQTPIYPQTNNNLTVSQSNMNFIEPIDSSMMMFTAGDSNVIKPNMQPYAYPKIINIGNGKMFMTFIDDALNRSSENRSMLMYSIYDNNGWSAPLPVFDDGTADFEPEIITDNNGGVHILWKNAKVLFNDDITLEDMSENMELHYIHWNGSTFENSTAITNNDSYEISAQIAFNGNNLSIVWQENSNNDIFGISGNNSIYRKQYTNGSWKNIETIASNTSMISSINTSYINGINVVIYSTKTNHNLSTINDLELFYFNGTVTNQLTENDIPDYAVKIVNNEIYWISGNSIVSITDCDINTQKKCADLFDNVSNMTVLDDSSGNKVIVVCEDNGQGATFKALKYDTSTDSFGNFYPISKDDGVIRGWDACIGLNGEVELAYCYADYVNEGTRNLPYGDLCLIQKSEENICDIAVNPVVAYNGKIASEESILIKAEILNNGSSAIDQYRITVFDENESIVKSIVVDQTIENGEIRNSDISVTLPSKITKTEYSILVEPIGLTDVNSSDNMASFTIGYADICIDSIEEFRIDNTRQMKIKIKNTGFDTVDAANITLYDNSFYGIVLDTSSIGVLAPGAEYIYTYILDSSYSTPNSNNKSNLICINIDTETEESNYENNKCCYSVYPDCSINAFASTPGGTVSGNGIYQKDSKVEVLAMPSAGFVFQGWYENNIRIPDAGSLYSFDAVCNRNLEARFVELESCSIEAIEGTAAVVDNQNKYLRGITPLSDFDDYFIVTNGGSVCKIYNNNYSTYNATGVIVQLLSSNGTVVDTYHIVITGDINGDGAIDAFDVIMLDFYLNTTIEIDDVFLAACDMNLDGEVDTTDYTLLRNYVMCI